MIKKPKTGEYVTCYPHGEQCTQKELARVQDLLSIQFVVELENDKKVFLFYKDYKVTWFDCDFIRIK